MSALSHTPPQSSTFTHGFNEELAAPRPVAHPWHSTLRPVLQHAATTVWRYLQQGKEVALLKKRNRRLRVTETLSFGDKRSVSILEVDGQSFLVGSSGTGIALLASLSKEQPAPFQRVLEDSLLRDEVR